MSMIAYGRGSVGEGLISNETGHCNTCDIDHRIDLYTLFPLDTVSTVDPKILGATGKSSDLALTAALLRSSSKKSR